jgi:NAD(P)-dependent dehydrogenase (short-subunit alcohol dehydrogenase family)
MSAPLQQLQQLFGMHGKVAVVTGASSGIGRGVAELLLAVGAKVVVAGATSSKVADAAADLKAKAKDGADCIGVTTDIRDERAVRSVFDVASDVFGTPEVVVNCAGVFWTKPFLDLSAAQWDDAHATNSRGAFLVDQEAIRRMKAAGRGGAIVNVSSTSAIQTTLYGHAQYASSKAGVNALVRTLALEFAPDNIRVNAVMPGGILTEGSAAMFDQLARLKGPCLDPTRFPMNRPGRVEEVANACLFLASPAASYITGQLLIVDGGFGLS